MKSNEWYKAVNGFRADAGAPSHSAEEGTLYYDKTNDILYANTDGSTTWEVVGDQTAP